MIAWVVCDVWYVWQCEVVMCGLNDVSGPQLVAFVLYVLSVIWSVEVVYGCVWHCVSVMLLWKCAAAVLGVAVPIVCDVVVDVVVRVIVSGVAW